MSGETIIPEKAVVLRTGGVGDFVLTIPFLVSLVERECNVTVATRHSYFSLLGEFSENLSFVDVDEWVASSGSIEFDEVFQGATVYSFWKDRDGSLKDRLGELGIQRLVELESRPEEPPHVVNRMFQSAGLQWQVDFMDRSWLRAQSLFGDCLWLHPGSGSPTKNAPLSWFLERIDRWFAEGQGSSVVVSFGEADLEVEESFRANCGDLPLEFLRPSTLCELRNGLVKRAAFFVGNDSGPSHLAAALGVPSEVVFTRTDPDIWRPLGENLRVVRLSDLD